MLKLVYQLSLDFPTTLDSLNTDVQFDGWKKKWMQLVDEVDDPGVTAKSYTLDKLNPFFQSQED